MAFYIQKNGMWQEPENVKRPESGAWVDCDAVHRYKDDAWQEVWSAEKLMRLVSRTMTTGSMSCGDINSSHEGANGVVYITDQNDSGEATFVIDGEFTNPTLELMHTNWFFHRNNSIYITGGYLYAYGIKADGTVQKVMINDAVCQEPKQFSYVLNGDYVAVGIHIKTSNFSVTSFEPMYYWDVYDVKIDGKKCVFNDNDTCDW